MSRELRRGASGAAGTVLKFVPKLEEEYVVAPVTHFLFEVLGAAIDATKPFDAPKAREFRGGFFCVSLNGAADRRCRGLVLGQGIEKA